MLNGAFRAGGVRVKVSEVPDNAVAERGATKIAGRKRFALNERIGAPNISVLKVVLWENDIAWAAFSVNR